MAEKKQRKPKPNPYNNPIAQALIDIKRVLWDLGITLTDIDDIIEEMNANEERVNVPRSYGCLISSRINQ